MTAARLANSIIIASGKGGVGKTWLSINLAHALINQKKRVLLFDGDLGFANVDTQLGLNPKWDLKSVFKRNCSFEEAISSYRPNNNHSSCVDIIAGHSMDGISMIIPERGIVKLRESLLTISPNYDHLILDLSAGLSQIIQEFTTFAQQCLVVVTEDTTSITDAIAFIKVMNFRNPDLPLHIIVNMAKSDKHGHQVYTSLVNGCAEFLNKIPPLVGIIHKDECVPESIKRKTSTLSRHPTSQAAQAIEKIALHFSEKTK